MNVASRQMEQVCNQLRNIQQDCLNVGLDMLADRVGSTAAKAAKAASVAKEQEEREVREKVRNAEQASRNMVNAALAMKAAQS